MPDRIAVMRRHLRPRAWVIAAAALAVVLAAPGPGRGEEDTVTLPEWGAESSVGPRPDWSWLVLLRFVTESDYPPFNYYDEDGALAGFNVDLARAICRELEVTCEISPVAWESLADTLDREQADAAIASMAITPGTVARVDFTDSYYQTPAKFVTLTGSNIADITPEALAGKKIAVVQGTAHEAFLRDFYGESEILPFATDAEARTALREARADLLFGDAISLMFWINGTESRGCCQFRGRGFLEARYFGEGVGIAVAGGNIRLREILDYALARVRSSGRYEELLLRYFPLSIY